MILKHPPADWEIFFAKRTIWMEARDQGILGMRAVAAVLINRSNRRGAGLAAICLAPEQFSCWNTKDGNRILMSHTPENDSWMLSALQQLEIALTPETVDPTFGATCYYNPQIVPIPPVFAIPANLTLTQGKHRFYRE